MCRVGTYDLRPSPFDANAALPGMLRIPVAYLFFASRRSPPHTILGDYLLCWAAVASLSWFQSAVALKFGHRTSLGARAPDFARSRQCGICNTRRMALSSWLKRASCGARATARGKICRCRCMGRRKGRSFVVRDPAPVQFSPRPISPGLGMKRN